MNVFFTFGNRKTGLYNIKFKGNLQILPLYPIRKAASMKTRIVY